MSLNHLLLSIIATISGVITLNFATQGWIGTVPAFFLLVFVILSYNIWQGLYVFRRGGQLFFLNPTIHFGVTAPLITFGLGSLMFFFPEEMQRKGGFEGELRSQTIYYLFLLLLGFIGLWTGYWSRVSIRIGHWIRCRRIVKHGIRPEYFVNMPVLVVMMGLGYAAKFLMIALGIYGYSGDAALRNQTSQIREFLFIASQLSMLGLLVLGLTYFRGIRGSRRAGLWLLLVFVLEVFFGIFSGFKSQVIMPILVLAVSHYAVRGVIPKWVLPGGLVLLVLAYSIIEPFRVVRYSDPNWQSRSFFYIAEAMFSGTSESNTSKESPGWEQILVHLSSSHNAVPVFSEGITYANENPVLPEGSPRFLRDIFLAPVIAVVPRFLWSGKPETNHGSWYSREVMGLWYLEQHAVGMSAVTYLYFAGGVIGVMLGFLVFGILQRAIFIGFAGLGAGGMLIFLGLFSQIRGLDSVYYTFIVTVIRYIPILFIVQMLVFRPMKK